MIGPLVEISGPQYDRGYLCRYWHYLPKYIGTKLQRIIRTKLQKGSTGLWRQSPQGLRRSMVSILLYVEILADIATPARASASYSATLLTLFQDYQMNSEALAGFASRRSGAQGDVFVGHIFLVGHIMFGAIEWCRYWGHFIGVTL